jgi:hypothetical protein
MRTVIGDKRCFAIEYEIQPSISHVMGSMRLWLEGMFIGAIEDVNVLSAILYQLEGLSPETHENSTFIDKSASDIHELVYSEDALDNVNYCFTPNGVCDDFSIVVFSHNGYFYFIWRLNDNPFFTYPDYPKDIQSARVSIDKYQKIVMDFEKVIREARSKLVGRMSGA